MGEVESPVWHRSSRCTGGNCVEVAKVDGRYLIRDSKNPDMAALSFTESEWRAFSFGMKSGEFAL
jgi:hypothetical protein